MKRIALTWVALLALMLTSLAVSRWPLGAAALPAALAIALAKTALVARVFMRLQRGAALFLLCAAAGVGAWVLLNGLTWLDLLTRAGAPPAR